MKELKTLYRQAMTSPLARASIWAASGFGSAQILRLASNLILTRLLAPEMFGLMAIVTIVMIGLELITDVGIDFSIVQNKNGEREAFYRTAWSLKVARGLLIALILTIMAGPVSGFYGEPQLAELFPYMAVSVAIFGFSSTALALAKRKLWAGRVTAIMLLAQLASTVVAISWAWHSPTVWAFVFGHIAHSIVYTSLSHALFPFWKMRIAFNKNFVLSIVKLGKWIFLTSILYYLANQIDRIIFAKVASLKLVGLYSIGFMWAQLSVETAHIWLDRIFFPHAAEFLRCDKHHKSKLIEFRRKILYCAFLFVIVFSLSVKYAFYILYPEEYWPSVEVFSILIFGSMMKIIDETYRAFHFASGNPKYSALSSACTILTFLAIVWPLFNHFGMLGFAFAYALSQLSLVAAACYGAHKAQLSDPKFDMVVICAAFSLWIAMLSFSTDHAGVFSTASDMAVTLARSIN